MEVDYDFRSEESRRFKIKAGWDKVGDEGELFGTVHINQLWAIVLFDGEEDPDLYKASGLMVADWKELEV